MIAKHLGITVFAFSLIADFSIAHALSTPNVDVTPKIAAAGDSFRGNIAGLTEAIESGRFHGKRLANLYQFRGILYSDVMELDLALADLGRAIQLDGANAENHVHYGIVLYKQKRDEESLQALAKGEKLNKKLPLLYMQRGYVQYYRQRYAEALKSFEQAWALNKSDHYTALWVYIAAERIRPHDGRAKLVSLAAQLDETQWPSDIVRLYLGDVTPDTFEQRISEHRLNDWQSTEAYFYLGQLFALQGDREAAARQFQQAQAMRQIEFTEHHLALRELEAWLGGL